MKRVLAAVTLTATVLSSAGVAPEQPARPKITGIAHVRLYSSDLEKSRSFYAKGAGLSSVGGGCAGLSRPCFPVNWYQQIELEPASSPAPANWLAEVGFATDDAAQLRRYLLAHGVSPGAISKDPNGAQHFELRDPEGHRIAFVQQPLALADYKTSADQISTRLFHAGFVVRDAALQDRFYRGLLGFRMYWHGGFQDNGVDWEELQVPDGSDWIEYMLNISPNADHRELGVQNHFSLGVTSIKSTYSLLLTHGLKTTDDKPEIGRDGKWAFDIYDPDATRVEFMEFQPAQKPCCNPYEAAHPVP